VKLFSQMRCLTLLLCGWLPVAAASADDPPVTGSIGTNIELISEPMIVPVSERQLTIDLSSALRLAAFQNPRMALAREVINEAVARRKEALALWLPSLNAGTNYHLHTGVLQTAFGQIRSLTEQSLYLGGGSGAISSSTIAVPAVRIFSQVGDAYYLPLAAGQTVTARAFDSRATDNVTLLDVADRFLTLVAAEARREALLVSLQEIRQIEQSQKAFADAGQGRDADYRRARANRLLMELDEMQAQEDAAVASAELSRVLHLDPSIRLVTSQGPIELLELVDERARVEELVSEALRSRPEIAARTADIGAADFRWQNERMRPWLPLVSAGYSGGAMGGGSNRTDLGVNSTYSSLNGRTDFDVMAVWTFQNLGAGNRALQGSARAEREQAVMERALVVAQIRREVAERQAQLRARHKTVAVSWTQLSAAERGAREELLLTRSGEALPIEALNSVTRLATARQQLLTAVIEYNRAALRLIVALGTNLGVLTEE
jgi:outer membrane protein TolC